MGQLSILSPFGIDGIYCNMHFAFLHIEDRKSRNELQPTPMLREPERRLRGLVETSEL